MKRLALIVPVVSVFLFAACGDDDPTGGSPDAKVTTTPDAPPAAPDATPQALVETAMRASITTDLTELTSAVTALQAAAPTPVGRGWDATMDATAITAMKTAWKRARVAYEHVEGALAPIFPDLDFSMDARYDDYLTDLLPDGDQDLFDDVGATGMHSIERILYAPTIRAEVITFESNLVGYKAAAFPATATEASDFKTKLARRLVDDAISLETQWSTANIDIDAAYKGLIDLMNEQHEKVNKAATGEEESRYANITLFDLRNNLDGTQTIFNLFHSWLISATGGAAIDANITAGMNDLGALYDSYAGDEVPAPPEGWTETPTEEQLATDFGILFASVNAAVDETNATSIVGQMTAAGELLGLRVRDQ